ncbi:MAG: glycine cleavage system aminomethyltransferase GcvT [Rhodospirillaceae bacterium]|nr:glycine cleavage system aminomethyltransferase GcvT [Rhodospirillaceae bacterium]MDE0617962.1 glycine cleavage system aminomethyltransferase GcvT [Rhodospirillaceae bacterium]
MATENKTGNKTGPAALRTPLYDLHVAQGGRMVDFAGYALPVQYGGIIAEHEQARSGAALFDVSHMGQARIVGAQAAEALESLVPGDIAGLGAGRMRYTQLTDDNGGIRDDLMVTRLAGDASGDASGDALAIVVNAACKDDDFAYLGAALAGWDCALEVDESAALLAFQGPEAAAVLEAAIPGADGLAFLQGDSFDWRGVPLWISRSGYTGEDGFEISLPAHHAAALAEALLACDGVAPAGLGARDSLRLEAGLCLYGHDIDLTTTPVEAGLAWSIGKRRRAEGGFPGDGTILDQLRNGPARRRIGLRLEGRAPAREGAEICTADGAPVGRVTSGGFGPTVGGPVAMGYVAAGHAAPGTPLALTVRGRALPARVACLPFIAPGYRR